MLASQKISVIVPNYNYGEYLQERLASIVNQTYPIYELIFLDDASSDHSLQVAQAFQKETSIPMQIVSNTHNSGSVFQQWIKGIELSRGDYVWIAEADDLCDIHFLSEAMEGFNTPDVVLSYTMSKVITSEGDVYAEHYREGTNDIDTEKWKHDHVYGSEEAISQFFVIKNIIPNASSVVFKKINPYPIAKKIQTFTVAGDWYFYYWLLQHGKMAYNHKALNYWRRHDKSVSAIQRNNQKHYSEIVEMQTLIYNNYSVSDTTWEKALAHREKMRLWLHIYHEHIEQYLFIVTYGESGSEILMKVLNHEKGIDIKGENMDLLFHIYRSYTDSKKAKQFASVESQEPTHPWYGIQQTDPSMYVAKLCNTFVEEILQPKKGTSITGFKEIRFWDHDIHILDGYISFLFEFFPNSKIIFHRRDLENVMTSGWMKDFERSILKKKLETLDKWMVQCHEQYKDRTLITYYEKFFPSVSKSTYTQLTHFIYS